jgi:hypothetical protein
MRALVLAVVGLVGLPGCGSHSDSCSVPAGCLNAERVDGACTCAGWETVSSETVPLPFVVVDVSYRPVGAATVFRYGATWEPSMVPQSASSLGTTLRAVIRRPDGTEQVARVGTLSEWAGLEPLSATTLRAGEGGLWTFSTDVDLPPPSSDSIKLWANPAVTVVTSYVGEKTVNWSVAPRCLTPGLDCTMRQDMGFSTAGLRGGVTGDWYHDAFLTDLGTAGRAALLSFDSREAAGAVRFPRYQFLAELGLEKSVQSWDATWYPCVDPLEFEVLTETAVPLDGGDTFVLQYGVQMDATCTPQRPGLLIGTTTPDCALQAKVFVDRLSGTLLMQPSAASSACTSE